MAQVDLGSSCDDMEPMDSVIAVHIVFLSIRSVRLYWTKLTSCSYFGTVIMVIYKRMAGKRQETIPLLAGTGIPLTATGLALLCSSYYVLIGEQCTTQFELNGGDFAELYERSFNITTIPESKSKLSQKTN